MTEMLHEDILTVKDFLNLPDRIHSRRGHHGSCTPTITSINYLEN